MTTCHDVRPLLPARAEELSPLEARTRAEHVATCARCAAEAATYSRLGHALAAMANLEVEPADGTLERVLVAIGRRRIGVTDPRVLAAAGSAGALVATVVVARAVRRRQARPVLPSRLALPSRRPRPAQRRVRLPHLPLPTPALARAK
jgi:anti-sigma factor RsiW